MRTGRRGAAKTSAAVTTPRRTAASVHRLCDRAPELAGEAWIRERAAQVRDDSSLLVENVRLRHLGDPVAAGYVARPVASIGNVSACARTKRRASESRSW